ncbi:ectoine/hydroxyectoine ABC transporter permease subunit EhuC [Microbacterium esteraromaticum]|uniref:Ectoine/hydroxyectoine ABC transporter permease subunit EhuC n=1 Tax=Microbacterium esteraromaticum TaxID=57043 RepID=A0A939DWZ9_9MICO|nr:ectoine/hydroxyectoine ABC transporter permease subunit EhuC [Microbacterium esteraromaticum]MBN8415742.1 ectoine/hydroxyectoine ABC transporter permease subunit EhuC [Microbacterium esteraromaticum]MBN8423911.1 ectoine/hydroxyectoine ABC transporter permease subunit EhuC [Microbacterium esteraromaticum]
MTDNLEALQRALPYLLDGLLITLQLTVGGALLAFAIAISLGLLARFNNILIRGFARTVIEVFRGTSLLVQLFFLFFVLPLPPFNLALPSIVVGILGLGLNYGAYGAEVVRGSINAVPRGQWEATTALSLSRTQRMWRVIFPQAWALMIPSLTNLLIQLLKGTAVVYLITIVDFTAELNKLRIDTDVFFAYSLGLVVYFVIAYLLTLAMNAIEVRAKHRLGQGTRLREAVAAPTVDAEGNTP